MTCPLITPDWPAPTHINAFSTTRHGGVSQPPFDSLNLGDHVNDNPAHVLQNRTILMDVMALPSPPLWLSQTHSTEVIEADNWHDTIEADGCISHHMHQVCTVLTADCLPVLMCDKSGQQVAAVHAGWRGLAHGILAQAVQQFTCPATDILVWLGPAIGPQHFEVGHDVYHAFVDRFPDAKRAFITTDTTHFLADLYLLARQSLSRLGINEIYGGHHCTVSEPSQFYSYRRDGKTGRMASLIWIAEQ